MPNEQRRWLGNHSKPKAKDPDPAAPAKADGWWAGLMDQGQPLTNVADSRTDPQEIRYSTAAVRGLLSAEGRFRLAGRGDVEVMAASPETIKKRRASANEELLARWVGVTDAEAADVLAIVRARAEDWRTGTAAVLGLITAALVITNAKDTAKLFGELEVRLGLAFLLIVSAGLGLASLGLAIRAANGPSWLDTKVKEQVATLKSTCRRDLSRAQGAASDLRIAQRLLWGAISIFVVLVACFWVVPYDWNPIS